MSRNSSGAPNKKDILAAQIAKAVGAGREVAVETVDFSDPNRPPTCLEVDFPILPINQIAVIEGNAGKPIYQMSKWWARRRSSVFRSLLLSASMKAPEDKSQAAKAVWDVYYANHQKLGALSHLKVADIFMGGGTTLVEGSRLGLQMYGNDLNPVAWFVVKQEFAKVKIEEVKALLADIEAEVRPQIMPYFYCDGPNGEKGKWTHKPTGREMGVDFDPLSIPRDQRKDYDYQGPEIIYTFWAKHGPCSTTGCGHRTPIMSSPVMAIKTLTVKAWDRKCRACGCEFDVEAGSPRMAPDVSLVVTPDEKPFTTMEIRNEFGKPKFLFSCPRCGVGERVDLPKATNKKVELTLLVHPQWLAGSPKADAEGRPFGGSAQDDAESTARWNAERASKIKLLEVRGTLPAKVTCPDTGIEIVTDKGTVPTRSHFECGACGTTQDVLSSIKPTGKTGPMAGYAFQGYAPARAETDAPYNGRFFASFDSKLARQADLAAGEWEARRDGDLANYWPRSEVPYGFMTHMNNGGIPNHGFTHWWTMFNPRQLLVHTQMLKAITTVGEYAWSVREYVLGAFQQYLRNQNLFCFWDIGYDKLVPHMSNNNYHPKSNVVENSLFGSLGRGNWSSCIEGLEEGLEWMGKPWDHIACKAVEQMLPQVQGLTGKSEKVSPGDPVCSVDLRLASSTDLAHHAQGTLDLVITDPPFGGLLHYSELSDFFYVWLRLALKDKYPEVYSGEYTPKTLEVVANRAREPEDADGYYQRLLTQCWREAHRILKPGGILAFTFHHSEDEPWVAVLKSLFDAGFYLEATYPIRSDETKGEGAKPGTFGSQTIEYDIIHVCRKRTEDPKPVSWARMRREVLAEVRQIQDMLENHAKGGLPAADLQVIRRGKALEYFSRHYGQVLVDEDRSIDVKEALVGINALIEEGSDSRDPLPSASEPVTRQFLRIFQGESEVKRDQMQKYLRGTGMSPNEYSDLGWCTEKSKVFTIVPALEFARSWIGKLRQKLTSDYEQAWFLVGACVDGSGIDARATLNNDNFRSHPALRPLLDWMSRNGNDSTTRTAAMRARTMFDLWAADNGNKVRQLSIFEEEGA